MEEEFFEDLLMAGHEVVESHPDIEFDDWVDALMRQYPSEVVDALGQNPIKVQSSLEDLWNNNFRGS